MFYLVFLLAMLSNIIVFAIADANFSREPIRRTRFGYVKGRITERIEGALIEEFLGVPYAAPPVGDLRFQVILCCFHNTQCKRLGMKLFVSYVHCSETPKRDGTKCPEG